MTSGEPPWTTPTRRSPRTSRENHRCDHQSHNRRAKEPRRKLVHRFGNTTATLEALTEVAARIALQTKIAVTTADGGEFAEWIPDRIHQNFNALRKTHDKHPFAPLEGASRWQGSGKEAWMTGFAVAINSLNGSRRPRA